MSIPFLLQMQFWLVWDALFIRNNHPNDSHSAKRCRKMEILRNWKTIFPFNPKHCDDIKNMLAKDRNYFIQFFFPWVTPH